MTAIVCLMVSKIYNLVIYGFVFLLVSYSQTTWKITNVLIRMLTFCVCRAIIEQRIVDHFLLFMCSKFVTPTQESHFGRNQACDRKNWTQRNEQ
jgi:hypothetical protein